MKIKEIKEWIEEIKLAEGDDESQHSLEDGLYQCFVNYIANGGRTQLKEKAKLIAQTQKMNFARWCA